MYSILLSVVILSFYCHSAQYHLGECFYAECQSAVILVSVIRPIGVMLSTVMLTVILMNPIELVMNQSMVLPAFSPKRRLSFKNISIKVIYIKFNTWFTTMLRSIWARHWRKFTEYFTYHIWHFLSKSSRIFYKLGCFMHNQKYCFNKRPSLIL